MDIREFQESDWSQVWPIIHEVVAAADTFAYDPQMTEEDAREIWLLSPPGRTVVAVEDDEVLGTAVMGPNHSGPGSHIATASFMVASGDRGKGVGAALCQFALSWAQHEGYAGMQFNAVAETNTAAVRLYERLGFETIGTIPGAFEHPTEGRVGLHVMYRQFADSA